MKAPVNETLAVALIAVVMIIGQEKMHDSALVATHQDGFAQGYALGQSALGETMAKRVTDKACMSWWFNGDTKRVAESIKKVKLQ